MLAEAADALAEQRRGAMAMTPFAAILQKVVEQCPGAIGGAFAASDGEMVDAYTSIDATDFAVITAHYGVVMALLDSAFGVLHFGGPTYFMAQHEGLSVLVHAVDAGYYALLAFRAAPDLDAALGKLAPACALLKREMG